MRVGKKSGLAALVLLSGCAALLEEEDFVDEFALSGASSRSSEPDGPSVESIHQPTTVVESIAEPTEIRDLENTIEEHTVKAPDATHDVGIPHSELPSFNYDLVLPIALTTGLAIGGIALALRYGRDFVGDVIDKAYTLRRGVRSGAHSLVHHTAKRAENTIAGGGYLACITYCMAEDALVRMQVRNRRTARSFFPAARYRLGKGAQEFHKAVALTRRLLQEAKPVREHAKCLARELWSLTKEYASTARVWVPQAAKFVYDNAVPAAKAVVEEIKEWQKQRRGRAYLNEVKGGPGVIRRVIEGQPLFRSKPKGRVRKRRRRSRSSAKRPVRTASGPSSTGVLRKPKHYADLLITQKSIEPGKHPFDMRHFYPQAIVVRSSQPIVFGVLSGAYGIRQGLDAVLEHMTQRYRIDMFLYLGNAVGLGGDPLKTLESLESSYPKKPRILIAGDRDREVLGSCSGHPNILEQAMTRITSQKMKDFGYLPSVKNSMGAIVRVRVGDGNIQDIILTHGALRERRNTFAPVDDTTFVKHFELSQGVPLVLSGGRRHYDQTVGKQRFIAPGSASLSKNGGRYTIVIARETGIDVHHESEIPFDYESALRDLGTFCGGVERQDGTFTFKYTSHTAGEYVYQKVRERLLPEPI